MSLIKILIYTGQILWYQQFSPGSQCWYEKEKKRMRHETKIPEANDLNPCLPNVSPTRLLGISPDHIPLVKAVNHWNSKASYPSAYRFRIRSSLSVSWCCWSWFDRPQDARRQFHFSTVAVSVLCRLPHYNAVKKRRPQIAAIFFNFHPSPNWADIPLPE